MELEKAISKSKILLKELIIEARHMGYTEEQIDALRTVIEAAGKDRQQIIFEHYVKVRETMKQLRLWSALCFGNNDELKAFIEKVETPSEATPKDSIGGEGGE